MKHLALLSSDFKLTYKTCGKFLKSTTSKEYQGHIKEYERET